ncbi:hypothetical protein [Chloroflexus sp.]|uniref:hypothetical protein n=1 Tax=Chloroflexus sp. TaxID=1904827 RepID=UPI003C73B2A8
MRYSALRSDWHDLDAADIGLVTGNSERCLSLQPENVVRATNCQSSDAPHPVA